MRIVFVLFLYYHLLLQVKGNTTRIVGGDLAPPEFGKFHVSLQNLTGYHVCGGAIISPRHLTTAAHCVYRVNKQYIKVVVGTTDLDKGGFTYDLASIYVHKEYDPDLKLHDIAVLKVKGQFDLHHIKLLQLDRDEIAEGEHVSLLGFGAQEANGESNRYLLNLNQTVFNQETCRYAMRYTREVYDTMFCTFTSKDEGTCHGDSGSPLIQDNKLVGIVSWGIPCAVGFPDVHTRISPYVEWIQNIINTTSSQHCPPDIKRSRGFDLFLRK